MKKPNYKKIIKDLRKENRRLEYKLHRAELREAFVKTLYESLHSPQERNSDVRFVDPSSTSCM